MAFVRRPRSEIPANPGRIVELAGARRSARYGPIRQGLAQRMAQRRAPSRPREAMRCAGDDRHRDGCRRGGRASQCRRAQRTCPTPAADGESLRVVDASLPRRMIATSRRRPITVRPAAIRRGAILPVLAGVHGLAAPGRALASSASRAASDTSSIGRATARAVEAESRPGLLLVVRWGTSTVEEIGARFADLVISGLSPRAWGTREPAGGRALSGSVGALSARRGFGRLRALR
jgi:hypothetical protein